MVLLAGATLALNSLRSLHRKLKEANAMPMWCSCTVSAAGHFVPGALHAAISYVPLYGASPLWFRAIVFSANVGAWATGHLQLEKYGVPLSVLRPAHDAFVTTVFLGLAAHFAAWYTFASIPYATLFTLSFVGGCLTPSLSLLKYASGDLDTSYDGNTKLTHNSRNWWAHAVADLAGFIFFVPWTLAWMPRSITGVLRKGGIV